ncbi:MAG TPA: DNA mismatch repair protein MutS, partial [bacterium]|nr:DNA mismatch repair protein MutS [bacterium]
MSLVKADTPMMRQFNALKEAYPDCILFFRAGDFYEMFGEDAKLAAEALQIALTTRNKSTENEVPMCGVPYHAYEQYLNKLTAQGFKVAIAEQMEDPAQAKGLVRREVTRVVTPGTTVSGALLAGDQHLYLVALEARHAEGALGAAWVDLSTGLFEVAEFAPGEQGHLLEVLRLDAPRELLLPEPRTPKERERQAALQALLLERLGGQAGGAPAVQEVSAAWFDPAGAAKRLAQHFGTGNLAGFGVEGLSAGLGAAGALLAYLAQTQKTDLAHLTQLRQRSLGRCMRLDESTLRHLEVFENPAPGGQRHTLFAVLNLTKTAMGARLLRRWLGEPLLDAAPLTARQDAVEELLATPVTREALRQVLARIRDLERSIARISLPVAGVADVVALREALGNTQFLPPLLSELRGPLLGEMAQGFDALEDVHRYLRERLQEEPSLRLAEGGYIAGGVLPELDHLRELARDSKAVMAALEAREREKTGIGSLKVRFNRVFGYYLEVSRVHQDKIPPGYQRKQTLANAERFTTPELQETEEQLLHAEERSLALELEEFQSIRTVLGGYARRMQATAQRIAAVDAVAALAQAAHENGYVRPALLAGPEPRRLRIVQGRHPVIERIAFDEAFIPND